MPNDNNRSDVAVFIDFENIYVSVRDKLDANPNFESIMDRCEDLGRVVIARAYADWYRYPRVTSALYANGIEPMYVPTYYYDRDMGRTGRAIKNSVDMNLCIDAMKTLFTNPNIAKFVLCTGDRDFIPLVNSIRQQGKEVIVIGIGGAASAHLAQSADEFIFYEALIGKPPSAELLPDQPRARMPEKGRDQAPSEEAVVRPQPEPAREPNVYDVLVQAIHLARERGFVCSFGSLKLLMKELMGGEFKESRYRDTSGKPFAKFKDFVLEAERLGKVQVFTNGTLNEVFLPGEDPYKLSQFAQDLEKPEDPRLPEEPVVASDGRMETAPVSTNGRRRRRRPRSGQRPAEQPREAAPAAEAPAEQPVLEEIEYAPPDSSFAPDTVDEAQTEAVFEDLLERIEQEDAAKASLSRLEPLAADQPVPEQAAPPAVVADTAPTGELEFTEDEWRVLREIVMRFDRPISFAQIHDALREARNRAVVDRTNEDLRTLIKQAINTGVLERIGKGSNVSYRLAAPPAAEEAEQPSLVEQARAEEAVEAPDQMALVEQAQAEEVPAAEVVEKPLVEQAQVEEVPAAEVVVEKPVTAPAEEPLVEQAQAEEAVEAPDQTALVEQAQAEEMPAAEQPVVETAPEEVAAAPARRTRRRRKPAAEAPAEPAAETPAQAVEAAAPAPEEPAPKRSRRKKTEEAPAAEEAARPKRTRRKKAEETAA